MWLDLRLGLGYLFLELGFGFRVVYGLYSFARRPGKIEYLFAFLPDDGRVLLFDFDGRVEFFMIFAVIEKDVGDVNPRAVI